VRKGFTIVVVILLVASLISCTPTSTPTPSRPSATTPSTSAPALAPTPATKQLYALSISVSPSQGGSVSHPSGDYEEGLQITLTATPSSGYQFASWSGDVSGTSQTITIAMDSNKRVTANFEKIKYNLSTSVSPPGSGSISPSSGTFDIGVQITLTATPSSGYQFASWSGDVSGTSQTITIAMDSNKRVTANFVRQYVWVTPISATASGYTQWGGTWYTGPPSLAIDGNEITAWTLNSMGEITFDLGSTKLISGIEAYWAGSVTNGNTVNIYIDGIQVLANEKFGATRNTRYFTPIRGRFVKYQTVALPHNQLLQIASWSEVAEFKVFVEGG